MFNSQRQVRVPAVARRHLLGVTLSVAAGAISAGCAAKTPGKFDTRIESAQEVKVNANQVRLKMRSLVDPMCGEIERAADQIAAGTPDPAVRRAAIRWKIEAVPALREALLQPNSYVALSDAWVLFYQMADFYETGAGRAALGDSAPAAVEACRHLEQEMAEVAAATTISGDISGVRAIAKKWAAEHPIRNTIRARESTLGRALEQDSPDSFSASDAAVWVAVSLDDLNRRLEVYSTQLPQQARWEVDLLGSDARLADAVPLAERAVQSAEKASATLDLLAPQVERTLGVAETAPALLASERRAALDALGVELTRAIAFVQQERVAGFQQITRERVAALADLQRSISNERKALDQDIERVGLELVDRAFWRLAQLLAAAVCSLGVGAAALLLLVKRMFLAIPRSAA